MGDKNFLLYMLVAFFLVVALSPIFMKSKQQPPESPTPTPTPTATPNQAQQQSSSRPAPAAKNATPQSSVATKQAASEIETVVQNDFYKITFTNRGAQAKSWVLKKYKDDKGNPLDLVNAPAAAQMGFPLSMWTYDEGLRKKLNDVLYVAEIAQEGRGKQSLDVKKNTIAGLHLDAPQTITFDYAGEDVTIHKSFSFDKSYVVKVETLVTRNGQLVQAYPAWPSSLGD